MNMSQQSDHLVAISATRTLLFVFSYSRSEREAWGQNGWALLWIMIIRLSNNTSQKQWTSRYILVDALPPTFISQTLGRVSISLHHLLIGRCHRSIHQLGLGCHFPRQSLNGGTVHQLHE